MIQIGDKVLFLCFMPVPRSKGTWRWCIGTAESVINDVVYLVDSVGEYYSDDVNRTKLYQKVNSE